MFIGTHCITLVTLKGCVFKDDFCRDFIQLNYKKYVYCISLLTVSLLAVFIKMFFCTLKNVKLPCNTYNTLYSKVKWKSYCTHLMYCPAQLSWLNYTALYRPLRCVTLTLLSWYGKKNLSLDLCSVVIDGCSMLLFENWFFGCKHCTI